LGLFLCEPPAKKGKKNILMMGVYSDGKIHGGICAVIACYLSSNLAKKYNIKVIGNSAEGTYLHKGTAFVVSYFILFYHLCFSKLSLIHIHTASGTSFIRNAMSIYLAKLFKIKIILHIHGAKFDVFYFNGSILTKRVITQVLDKVDCIIVLSSNWEKFIRPITRNQNINIIYNPVDINLFTKKSGLISNNFYRKNILFLGALEQRKGILDIIQAMPTILAKAPDVKLWLCGNGRTDHLEKMCEDLGVSESVKIFGWIDGKDKIDKIVNADLLALPSYHEGLPVAIIEAMAAGLPVVSTPVGGIPELIENGKNGFLVPPGDKEALANAILDILLNPELQTKMASNNREKALQLFDMSIISNQIDSIYESVLKKC
jgi:Glycosyltransferase